MGGEEESIVQRGDERGEVGAGARRSPRHARRGVGEYEGRLRERKVRA